MSGQRIGNKTLLCKLSNASSPAGSPAPVRANSHPQPVGSPVPAIAHPPPVALALTPTLPPSSPSLSTVTVTEPTSNLYIKPLLPTTSEEQLRGMFSPFGVISECKVMIDKATGLSRQIGFVRFENIADATAAMQAMNGIKLNDSAPALIVKYAETETQKAMRKAKNAQLASPQYPVQYPQGYFYMPSMAYTNGYYGYPPSPYTQPTAAGSATPPLQPTPLPAASPSLMVAPAPGSPALAAHSLQINSPMRSPAPPFTPTFDGKSETGNLFCFHLPSDIDDSGLFRLFAAFGPLESVKVIADRTTGESKGYGFVKFYRFQDAVSAMHTMNGYHISNKRLKVSFKSSGGNGSPMLPTFNPSDS